MLVFLIGYRGTGKSTVAELLARQWNWAWVDADTELERRAGKTIQEIFSSEGEAGFREREQQVVAELSHRERAVVALGGGAVLRAANRAAIRRGRVIWLRALPHTLAERLAADPSTAQRRPQLTVEGGLEEIQQLLARREPLYRECADFTVSTDGQTAEQVAGEIVDWLQVDQR